MNTHTQRTLKALREKGLKCAIVERWLGYARRGDGFGVRKDLFGILDIIALCHVRGVIGVQSTGQDFSGHRRKIEDTHRESSIAWLTTPGTCLELWGWRKVQKVRGSKIKVWRPRIKVYTLEDFNVTGPLEGAESIFS